MTIEQLQGMTVLQLRATAKKEKLKGYSSLRKAEIYKLLVSYYESKKEQQAQQKQSIVQLFNTKAKNIMSIAQHDIEVAYAQHNELVKERSKLIAEMNASKNRHYKAKRAKEINIVSYICKMLKEKLKRLSGEIVVNPITKETCPLNEMQQYAKQAYKVSNEKQDYASWFSEVFTDTAFFDEVI